MESRFEVYSEQYVLSIEVEAKLVISMATTNIYPAATRYLSDVSLAASSAAELGIDLDKTVATSIAANTNGMMASVDKLSEALAKEDHGSVEEHMQFCANTLRSLMDEVRGYADALETEVADDMWPLPTYQEMLFIK